MADKNVNDYIIISLHCSNLHHVFTNEKGELTILTTKHGPFSQIHTTRKVCLVTTNYGHNEFAGQEIGKFIF